MTRDLAAGGLTMNGEGLHPLRANSGLLETTKTVDNLWLSNYNLPSTGPVSCAVFSREKLRSQKAHKSYIFWN